MIIIKSDTNRELYRKRKQHVDEYEAKASQYAAEVKQFEEISKTYIDNLKLEIYQTIGVQFIEPFMSNLSLEIERASYGSDSMLIRFKYTPASRDNIYYKNGPAIYPKGVPFELSIFVGIRNYTENPDKETVVAPSLANIRNLTSEDYDILIKEIELFKRIDSLEWGDILERAKGPKRSDYVITPRPGNLDTSMYDTPILDNIVGKTKGRDLWVLVNVTRSNSFDRFASDVRYPNVTGYGWLQLIKSSPAFYIFHYIPDHIYSNFNTHTSTSSKGLQGTFTQSNIDSALKQEVKLKKLYISIPEDKPIYLSSSDLVAGNDPEQS